MAEKRPKIGLALGAGSARGIAHMGVLRVLERYKVPIDCIAGCSIGAMIGGLYASGMKVDFMVRFASELQSRSWVDLGLPRRGLIAGNKVETMLRLLTREKNIEELAIPFAAVATDIERGEAVEIRSGPLYQAIRASISIPVVFRPYKMGGRLLVDGGVVDRVPVTLAKKMGADIVIAVDVNKFVTHQRVENIFDIMLQTLDIMERKILNTTVLDTDILIRPRVGHISPNQFHRVEELVTEGEKAAEAAISKISWVLRRNLSGNGA